MNLFYDKLIKSFVIPGTHGGSLVPNMVNRGRAIGKDQETGETIYEDTKQQVGFKVVNIPETWVELEPTDPRAKPSKTHFLDVIDDELVLVQIPEKTEDQIAQIEWSEKKIERAAAVQAIKVTTSSGKIFDGDEIAQERMTRAITASTSEEEKTMWKLADNTLVTINVAELREALRLSGEAQTTIWENFG